MLSPWVFERLGGEERGNCSGFGRLVCDSTRMLGGMFTRYFPSVRVPAVPSIFILVQVSAMTHFLVVVAQPLLVKLIFEFEARILWLVQGEDRRRLLSDRAFMLEAVGKNGLALEFASEVFRSDIEVLMAAVKQNGRALRFCVAVQQVGQAGHKCRCVCIHRRCIHVVTCAIKQNGMALEFAEKTWRSHRGLVYDAVWQNGLALKFASKELRSNLDVVLKAVSKNGLALEFASEECRSDEYVVHEAVCQNGLALEFASEDLRCDLDIVREAVSENGLALEFAAEQLQEMFSLTWTSESSSTSEQ